ncbi:hypothetical protein GGH94_006307 [Coemansia aciculifera]|uniref:RNA polymerase II assembly factor Rtp1 C-terminal domain-containing protein n=1 Tax=Coemansia aciculifera TaxID=417176 RepID=A0A9W8M0H0_9FUNG|nr:hypothetical protein GGH94_006307 [Coemansia aciculifera]
MSGVSRRYPSLVKLAALVEETMCVFKDVMKRLSKGGVSGDQKLLEGLSGQLRALDMLALLEAVQTEINDEAAQGNSDRRVPMPESNDSSQTIELDALGLRDRQVVAQALDIVVLFEVLPRLFPGVGVPVAQRRGSRPEAVDVLVRLQQRVPETWATREDSSLRTVDLGEIVSRLVSILESSARHNAGDVAAVVAAKHTPDLLAALLQVAYAPIPPQGTRIDSRYYVERNAERRVELRRAFTRVFDDTSPYLLFESLTSLLNAAVASHKASSSSGGGPRWFQTLCGRFLSRVLMRPNGARIATDYLVGSDSELTTDKLHRISNLLLTAPAGMPPDDYNLQVLPQVLLMAEIYCGAKTRENDPKGKAAAAASNPDQSAVDNIMDTQAVNARIVQAAVYALGQLADKDRAAFSTYVAKPVIAPLMRCFDIPSASLKPKPFVDDDDIGVSLVPPPLNKPTRRPMIEVISSDEKDSLPIPAVSTASELAAALDGIQRLILSGGVPSAAMLADLVVPVFAPLLRWLSFELASQGDTSTTLCDILVATLCQLPRSAAIATILNVVQTTFGPSGDDDGSDWPVFARDKDSGLTTLVWRSCDGLDNDGSEASGQQFVPADALLDVLGSDQLRTIIGDIFMTLLREQEALLDLLRSSGDSGSVMAEELPRKWWLVSQTTVAMVDKFGPAVLAKHTDVLAFVLNTMQRWIQSAGSGTPIASDSTAAPDVSIEELLKSLTAKDQTSADVGNPNDEDVEDTAEGVLGETEMLLTALMLLGQMMESSQQNAFAALASSIDPQSTSAPVTDSSMPAIEWDADALRLLRRIYTQIKHICAQQAVPMVAKMAGEIKLQVALVLALNGEASDNDQSANMSSGASEDAEVVRFNAAVRDVRDDLVPVQAHGIIELRNMVLSKSSALNSTDRMDAAIAIFTDMVRSPDSYIYLNAIRGLSSLADAHGRRFVPALAEMYTSSVPLEECLRIGEALLQSVQRAGPMLADYASDVVPRLLAAIHPAADVSLVDESSESVVRVHSALSILSAVAQACPLALQKWIAEITSTLEGMLLLSDTAMAPVLRRAAVVFWVSLLRGYGDRLLRLVDSHTLRTAYRSLRRVGESDSDEMTRLHALVGIDELDDLMKGQLTNITSNIL